MIGVEGRYIGMGFIICIVSCGGICSLTGRLYLVSDGDIDTRVRTDRVDKRHYFQMCHTRQIRNTLHALKNGWKTQD